MAFGPRVGWALACRCSIFQGPSIRGDVLIQSYEPGMVGELVSTYNKAIRGVPHCYPVQEEEFVKILTAVGASEGSQGRLRNEALLVASRDGSTVGFVHGAIAEAKDERERPHGTIIFLWYEPGKRSVGQKLLDAMQHHLLGSGVEEIRAYEQEFRYPFYGFRHAYLSQHLGHVQGLLGMNGYDRVRGEVFLDWPHFEPIRPDPIEAGIEVRVELREGRGKMPGVEVRALRAGDQVGFCGSISCGEFSRSPEVQDWIFTDQLRIEDEHQGRGLGKHILRRSLQEAHRIGYRNAAISNDWDNHRALLFYSNLGYRVVDWTYCLRRRWQTP